MPETAKATALLDIAARHMDAAAILLTAADGRSLDESRPHLQQAVSALNDVDADYLDEKRLQILSRLHLKSRALGRLLREADKFHMGAFRALETLNGGYTPEGQPGRISRARTISVAL